MVVRSMSGADSKWLREEMRTLHYRKQNTFIEEVRTDLGFLVSCSKFIENLLNAKFVETHRNIQELKKVKVSDRQKQRQGAEEERWRTVTDTNRETAQLSASKGKYLESWSQDLNTGGPTPEFKSLTSILHYLLSCMCKIWQVKWRKERSKSLAQQKQSRPIGKNGEK